MKNNLHTRRGFTQNNGAGQALPDNAPVEASSPSWEQSTQRGFTLIELLVVVLIISILAAVALPQYQKAVLRARFTQLVTSIDAIVKAQQVHFLEHGTYADSLDDLSIQIANLPNEVSCQPYYFQSYVQCSLSKSQKSFVTMQHALKQPLVRCISYSQTNFEADSLCAAEMGTSSYTSSCSEEKPCHVFVKNF